MNCLLARHFVPTQQIIRFTPVQTDFVRTKTRFRKYGAEEGNDNKNEVRKERWIKKHSPYKTGGGVFREESGLDMNSNKSGPLYDLPDYKFIDGTPGIPSFNKLQKMVQNKLYAQQIKEALDHIKSSQVAVSEFHSQQNAVKVKYEKSKFKQKGKLKFAEL